MREVPRRRQVALTLTDRVVGWLSPVQGLKRAQARTAMSLISGYAGASKRRPSLAMFNPMAASADADTLMDLDVLRARSRDLVRNDPLAQSAIATKAVNVIGSGHIVRPDIDHKLLGLSEAAAEAWEERALAIWNDWAESPDCDLTRNQPFGELEDLVYRSQLLSGDVLAIRRFKQRKGRALGFCIQVVEADRLSNPNWLADSRELAGGIEFDADGAARAYHIANRHALDRDRAGTIQWQRIAAYGPSGRRLVMHIHGVRWRPEMSRYAPLLSPVIEALKQRSRYSEAELMAAVVSACFAVAIKSDDGELGAGLAPQGGDKAGKGNEISLTEPGQIVDLLPNEELQSFEPGRPNAQFGPFIDVLAQEIGAGTDIPHELLVKRFQASYSASRAAMEMAWTFFRTERARHVSQFCRPVYGEVIAEAVARGMLEAPGFMADPLLRRAWLGATWMGPARPTIDPTKDAKADETYLKMGATSLTRIAAERFGTDIRAVARRRRQDGSEAASAAQTPAASQEGTGGDQTDTDTETS